MLWKLTTITILSKNIVTQEIWINWLRSNCYLIFRYTKEKKLMPEKDAVKFMTDILNGFI
jgi:hypothetical protein